jgi:arylsulfatase A-like enzyme
VAEVLKQAGYRTGGIGKWSLGNPGSWGIPLYQGFDHYFGHLSQDQAHFYYPDYLWDDDQVKLLHEVVMVDGVGKMQGNRGGANVYYTHDLFTERALDFIRENREKPFFLYLPYTIPHFSDYPSDTPEHYIVPSDEPYTNEEWPQGARNYAAMITRLDRDVGRILDLIGELGLDQRTLVIFTSDNGSYQGSPIPIEFFDSNGPLRGGKRDVYEGGIRIPFIARWAGEIPAGRVSDHVLAFWDVMPTLAEVAGLPAPEGIDGISMLSALKGEPAPEHEYLYWDYGHRRPKYAQAVRAGNWKGVRVGARSPLELYDLSSDVGEQHDVAAAHPDVVKRLEAYMKEAFTPDENYRIRELEEGGE